MPGDPLDSEEMMQTADEFGATYETHATPIYKFFYWRTRDAALAEDLTSSVFEKAWRSRANFHGGSRRAWLQRIARNLLIDHWRKHKDIYSEDVESLSEAEPTADTSARLDRAIEIEHLQVAVTRLSETMREVVRLRFIEGLSARQVGQRLQLTENNVRIIQYRALRQLRKYLDE